MYNYFMETLEAFYKRITHPLPQDLHNGIGHFNVFTRQECAEIPYSRKDYFKITFLKGKHKVHYADKTLQSNQYALMFSDPLVPYSWESLDGKKCGYFCIFTEAFFYNHGALRSYPIYKPEHPKLFLLNEATAKEVEALFEKMLGEIDSTYAYRDDLLRNWTMELIHIALKMEPASIIPDVQSDKKRKIDSLFNELLERQFPITSPYERLELKNPSDFARLLNIHPNHLNRTLKEVSEKTTTERIAQRVLEEAKILLKHSSWSVGDIAYALGYEESAHFINFFKKKLNQTPQNYRIGQTRLFS
ncbi:Bifunctional transcriptional activator/DNA repair enzyme AdaA [Sulfurospirillum diekertiae]|uniref:Bifunctional transcriptional activator/DNA repair enzyme AdaA n=2 Tax=Sulfurospirillum diekertiae TaxID=1854492 RepID=A0A1Y0HNA2_9BACT|nr:Bifunctional transcriptional activator/DNA repair enzyme AdaA [Sulfurospirillum diekertiae]ASC94384.1 Bifunctional transcriptional activator/DNA repair enzyme AdaA [Sulfurospirillum diekertiae]